MPQVRRAGVRDTTKGRSETDRRQRKSKAPKGSRKAANWAAAQMRAARHRASYALRLAALCVIMLAGLVFVLAVATGRLGDVAGSMQAELERRFAEAGFTVRWLDVAGAERVGVEEIAGVIGARPGAGMLAFEPERARARLEALSWVERAKVLRLWPDRIAVVIEERTPLALWQHEQVHRVVDRDGQVIEAARPEDFTHLPHVVGAGAATEAAALLALLDQHPEIAERVTHALRIGERRWNLRLRSGGDVLLPEGDAASALTLLSGLQAQRGVLDYDAQLIDLRTEGEMFLRPWADRVRQDEGRGA